MIRKIFYSAAASIISGTGAFVLGSLYGLPEMFLFSSTFAAAASSGAINYVLNSGAVTRGNSSASLRRPS